MGSGVALSSWLRLMFLLPCFVCVENFVKRLQIEVVASWWLLVGHMWTLTGTPVVRHHFMSSRLISSHSGTMGQAKRHAQTAVACKHTYYRMQVPTYSHTKAERLQDGDVSIKKVPSAKIAQMWERSQFLLQYQNSIADLQDR